MQTQEYKLRAMAFNYEPYNHIIDELDIEVFKLAANEIFMQRDYICRLEKLLENKEASNCK